jgi:hypothetical protein
LFCDVTFGNAMKSMNPTTCEMFGLKTINIHAYYEKTYVDHGRGGNRLFTVVRVAGAGGTGQSTQAAQGAQPRQTSRQASQGLNRKKFEQ